MKDIKSFLEKHSITEVESILPDMIGNARGKFYPTQKFLDEDQGKIPESVLIQDVTGDWGDYFHEVMDPTDKDMILIPDAETLRLVPWNEKPTAQIINDCYTSDGQLHPMACRSVLRRVLALYEAEGLEPVVAPEVEFYLVQKNTDFDSAIEPAIGRSGKPETARQSFSMDAVNEFKSVIDTLKDYCKTLELDTDIIVHETGAAQMEINFLHGNALDLADQVFRFKRALREAALKHDMNCTFMAKPMQSEPGSSMHIHQSLVDAKTGKNIFAGKTHGEYSEAFYHYLGGLQKYTPDVISLFAPNVNSYRRFSPGLCAPINFEWGFDNRTVGLRVPDAPLEATRVENRFAGADCNPYLAFAATLACGYLGLKNKLQPTKPNMGLAAKYGDPIQVARSLDDALRLLEGNSEIHDVLGKRFIDAYVGVKRAEFEAFSQVISAWEREFLLTTV